MLQYFEHVEEAEWAVQVLKATGKPVAASLCIGPMGDMHGVSPGECAVRLVKAGAYFLLTFKKCLGLLLIQYVKRFVSEHVICNYFKCLDTF